VSGPPPNTGVGRPRPAARFGRAQRADDAAPPAAEPAPQPRADDAARPAALVMARAHSAAPVKPGLAPLLGAERRAALQALLIRRAAAWAATAAPGAAFVAVEGSLDDVAALLPPGVTAFPQEGGTASAALAAAIARIGRGPLLIAGTDCVRLGPDHAVAALDDLAAGCDVAIGATLEGGWYLAALREPRADLLTVAADAWREGGIGPVIARAAEAGAEVGLIRYERVLATPDDAAALLADPLLPPDLRAALT
jgi:glycosyltransferase A (GT-A) superfamily protein (DUF2064 family)